MARRLDGFRGVGPFLDIGLAAIDVSIRAPPENCTVYYRANNSFTNRTLAAAFNLAQISRVRDVPGTGPSVGPTRESSGHVELTHSIGSPTRLYSWDAGARASLIAAVIAAAAACGATPAHE